MSGARCGHCLWTGDWIYTGRMLQAQKLDVYKRQQRGCLSDFEMKKAFDKI